MLSSLVSVFLEVCKTIWVYGVGKPGFIFVGRAFLATWQIFRLFLDSLPCFDKGLHEYHK